MGLLTWTSSAPGKHVATWAGAKISISPLHKGRRGGRRIKIVSESDAGRLSFGSNFVGTLGAAMIQCDLLLTKFFHAEVEMMK